MAHDGPRAPSDAARAKSVNNGLNYERYKSGMRFLNDKVKILGMALLFVALGCDALTLGRARGAAWVGKPLDMVIPVQLDAGEDATALCFEADVFHADTRQEASRVRVLVETTEQAQSINVRVRSSALVDEPVVTVYLRTGCGQKTSRRYVLLADVPSDAATPLAVARPPIARAVPSPVIALAPEHADVAPPETPPAAQARKVRVPKPPVTKVAPVKSSAAPDKKLPERASGQSRLKLDPLDLLSDRVANLDAYMTFEPPEDALRNRQRMQALEDALKTSQLQAVKTEASLADLKYRLQQAESERFPVVVLYGLLALVLASLTAVAFLWNRQRRQPVSNEDWWNAAAVTQPPLDLEPESVPPATPVPMPLAPSLAPEMAQTPPEPVLSAPGVLSGDDLDVNLMDMSDSTFGDFLGVEAHDPARYPPPPLPVMAVPTKPVLNFNSDAALDLRQQAEFFVSLGETERAIRLLKRQIEKNEEHNPFVYLDLLEILHSLNLKSDFQQWRERFQHVFSGRVPEFAHFKQEGKSLESYPEVLSRLTAQWSSPGIFADIDACIFQATDGGPRPAFDLAAFRDLLLLHAVACSLSLLAAVEKAEPQVEALSTAVVRAPHQAGAFSPVSVPPALSLPAAAETPPLLELDLDLDLADVPLDAPAPGPAAAGLDFELPGVPDGDQSSVSTDDDGLIDFELIKLSKND